MCNCNHNDLNNIMKEIRRVFDQGLKAFPDIRENVSLHISKANLRKAGYLGLTETYTTLEGDGLSYQVSQWVRFDLHYLLHASLKDILDTAKHEMAHVYCQATIPGYDWGHGDWWQKVAKHFGANPCAHAVDLKTNEGNTYTLGKCCPKRNIVG